MTSKNNYKAYHGRTELHYTPNMLPPRIKWAIPVVISRVDIPQYCEQLHEIASELQGASFYYPNIETRTTICRYEWHHKRRGRKFALRLGVLIAVGDNDIKQIDAYITTESAVADPQNTTVSLPEKLIHRLQQATIDVLIEAGSRLKPEEWRPRHVVYHIEMPYTMGVSNTIVSDDGRVRIFPTTIIKDQNKRVSAVCVTVKAPSNESAKPEALREIGLLCALISMANDQPYRRISLKWSRSRPPMFYLDFPDNVEVERLYPFRKKQPQLELCNKQVAERFQWVWKSFQCLTDDDKLTFSQALFAYYAGIETQGAQSTLAVVAYVAALSSLAQVKAERCQGTITCSHCGTLSSFRHDLIGDKAAVISLISELLGLDEKAKSREQIKQLMNRVYSKQRSAYVHGAELRHEEFYQGDGLPTSFPTLSEPVRDLYFYQNDLVSLANLTRKTLLQWLATKSHQQLDNILFGIESDKVMFQVMIASSVAIPVNKVVAIHTGSSAE